MESKIEFGELKAKTDIRKGMTITLKMARCPKCGCESEVNVENICASMPPQYSCTCKSCGNVFYIPCTSLDSELHKAEMFMCGDFNKFEYVSWSPRGFDLPQRATSGSAGYDFFSPVDAEIGPGGTVEFSLEVKCRVKKGEFLMIPPRSSLGFKNNNHVALTNTIGIIDSDYYNNPFNEGEIKLRLHNFGDKAFKIERGMALVQGIFVRYDTTIDDAPRSAERIGGLGSTDSAKPMNVAKGRKSQMYNSLDAQASN